MQVPMTQLLNWKSPKNKSEWLLTPAWPPPKAQTLWKWYLIMCMFVVVKRHSIMSIELRHDVVITLGLQQTKIVFRLGFRQYVRVCVCVCCMFIRKLSSIQRINELTAEKKDNISQYRINAFTIIFQMCHCKMLSASLICIDQTTSEIRIQMCLKIITYYYSNLIVQRV